MRCQCVALMIIEVIFVNYYSLYSCDDHIKLINHWEVINSLLKILFTFSTNQLIRNINTSHPCKRLFVVETYQSTMLIPYYFFPFKVHTFLL